MTIAIIIIIIITIIIIIIIILYSLFNLWIFFFCSIHLFFFVSFVSNILFIFLSIQLMHRK